MEKTQPTRPHGLTLEGRRRAVVTGVSELNSFSDQVVVMTTSEGTLTLLGEGLHVSRLNLEEGQLAVDGQLQAMEYDERTREKQSVLSRLFR